MDLYSQRLITEDGDVIAETRVVPGERGTDTWADASGDQHGRQLLFQERYLDTNDWTTIGTRSRDAKLARPQRHDRRALA